MVVQDGKIIDANLRRERIAVEELAEAMRLQQIASIDEVAWAVARDVRADQLHSQEVLVVFPRAAVSDRRGRRRAHLAREAVDAIEECFHRLARGSIENMPRRRLRLPDGALAVMAATDAELELAGSKTYLASGEGASFVVSLFASGETVAVIEADRLGQLRTGAASGVAARYLAKPGAARSA